MDSKTAKFCLHYSENLDTTANSSVRFFSDYNEARDAMNHDFHLKDRMMHLTDKACASCNDVVIGDYGIHIAIGMNSFDWKIAPVVAENSKGRHEDSDCLQVWAAELGLSEVCGGDLAKKLVSKYLSAVESYGSPLMYQEAEGAISDILGTSKDAGGMSANELLNLSDEDFLSSVIERARTSFDVAMADYDEAQQAKRFLPNAEKTGVYHRAPAEKTEQTLEEQVNSVRAAAAEHDAAPILNQVAGNLMFRSRETGEEFQSIHEAALNFCQNHDCFWKTCPIGEAAHETPCVNWVRDNPDEAAALMGCEVLNKAVHAEETTPLDESLLLRKYCCHDCGYEWYEDADATDYPNYCPSCGKEGPFSRIPVIPHPVSDNPDKFEGREPLTMAQMSHMDGEPVYMPGDKRWDLINLNCYVQALNRTEPCGINLYGEASSLSILERCKIYPASTMLHKEKSAAVTKESLWKLHGEPVWSPKNRKWYLVNLKGTVSSHLGDAPCCVDANGYAVPAAILIESGLYHCLPEKIKGN